MEYFKTVILKDGRKCVLRNGTEKDGQAVLDLFVSTHKQTDFLASYADECTFTAESESLFLKNKSESDDEIEIIAEIDGKAVGSAGISRIGVKEKIRHRAEFGISVDTEYQHIGIGRALTRACIECAKKAGYLQLELEVVSQNNKAIALYESEGFIVYGKNPRGFLSRYTGWQELTSMRKEL